MPADSSYSVSCFLLKITMVGAWYIMGRGTPMDHPILVFPFRILLPVGDAKISPHVTKIPSPMVKIPPSHLDPFYGSDNAVRLERSFDPRWRIQDGGRKMVPVNAKNAKNEIFTHNT